MNQNANLLNCAIFIKFTKQFYLSETKKIKSSSNVAHVISPPPLQTLTNSSSPQPKLFSKPLFANYILETATNTDVKVSVPFEAFKGDSSARMVALLKSDSTGLPTKPETINGNLVGMLYSIVF